MRIGRSFEASSSATSLLAGFLDVISCGFAAALVLGLISSLIQPKEAGVGTTEKPYRYFEFTVQDSGEGSSRPYLSPLVTYSRPGELARRLPLKLDPEKSWSGEGAPFQIGFVGAAAIENRMLNVTSSGKRAPSGFGVIIHQLEKDVKVDVQLIYSSRSDLGGCQVKGTDAPKIEIARRVFGGKRSTETASPQVQLSLGDVTAFAPE